ncbi:MAG: hypothetical protein ACM34C_06425 [Syntrophaceae bacterium]
MSGNQAKRGSFLLMTVLGLFLSACGGGGSAGTDGGSQLPPKILTWSAPTRYSDNSTLDPATELDAFEIYVNTSGSFANSDAPVAYVQAVDPGSGQVTTEFNLANLGPFLSPGVPYRVSLRAVALTGARSDFSPAASFSF